jgi:hypothetical protein
MALPNILKYFRPKAHCPRYIELGDVVFYSSMVASNRPLALKKERDQDGHAQAERGA